MVSWPPQSLIKSRLKSNNYRSCSSSKYSGEEVVVSEDNVLVGVTILVSSFSCDKVLKAEFNKIIISRINKKGPMNIIICSTQGNIHRTTQADINSSVVSRLSKVYNSSSLTSSIHMRGRSKSSGRKCGVKNRSKI